MENQITISSDGGSRGNPGPAACAFVVQDSKGNLIFKDSKYLGITTNNVAEYNGLLLGLEWILTNKNSDELRVDFLMDSELIIKQLNGIYRVKDENLKKFYLKATSLKDSISSAIFFSHIPRTKNKEADLLVNEELDKEQK